MCSHPRASKIYVPLIVDENFIYCTTFLSSFTKALKGVVHHHNKTHSIKILPLQKTRWGKCRQGKKTKGKRRKWTVLYSFHFFLLFMFSFFFHFLFLFSFFNLSWIKIFHILFLEPFLLIFCSAPP